MKRLSIHLELDWKCLSEEKKKTGKLGGTERFFMMLLTYLKSLGHSVNWIRESSKNYDLAIFSNSYNPKIQAKKKILFIGSWHAQPTEEVDEIVWVSEYTKKKYGSKRGEVIYACIEPDITNYLAAGYVKNRIVTVANPNRFIDHAVDICNYLETRGRVVEWCVTGGNKLYSDQYPEPFKKASHKFIHYQGVLERADLLSLLASAHMSVYPNFTNNSETMGVSPVEAAALRVPTIVPARLPFLEVMGTSSYYVQNSKDAGDRIIALLENRVVLPIDLTPYSYKRVMQQWDDTIRRTTNE